jgi:hypothetical protein
MYCDDQATIKQLPINMRATQIAAEAGQALQVGAAGGGGTGDRMCRSICAAGFAGLLQQLKGVPAAQGQGHEVRIGGATLHC